MRTTTQSSPGGCIFGLLGFVPALLGVFGCLAIVRWFALPAEDRSIDTVFWMIIGTVVVGWGGAIALWIGAYRALRSTDFRGYDSRDPDRTGMKW